MPYPRLEELQAPLWAIRKKHKWRRIPALLSDMHGDISRAWAVLPIRNVKLDGRAHTTPYFEFLSDAVVIAMYIMSRGNIQLADFPNETAVSSGMPLDEGTAYLHRLISSAFTQTKEKNLDELFYLQLATFVFSVYRLANSHERDLKKIIEYRHLT